MMNQNMNMNNVGTNQRGSGGNQRGSHQTDSASFSSHTRQMIDDYQREQEEQEQEDGFADAFL